MYKLLVTLPTGEQSVEPVDSTGEYYDISRVLWDERVRGPLPSNIELGKMRLIDGGLVKDKTISSQHAAAVRAKNVPKEVPIAPACEALINAGIYDDVVSAISSMSITDKVWWERAETIHIAFPLVETVRVALGLTVTQIEDLFIEAERIRKERASEI